MYQFSDGTDLIVNATSIGLFPDSEARVPVDTVTPRPGTVVCEMIPDLPGTRRFRDAEARGSAAIDGPGMLVNQVVIELRLWTGRDPRPDVIMQIPDRAGIMLETRAPIFTMSNREGAFMVSIRGYAKIGINGIGMSWKIFRGLSLRRDLSAESAVGMARAY